MILSTIFSSAISLSIQGSERLPEIAKILAPVVQDVMESLRHDDELLLDFSTVFVGIGVFLEYFEIRHELREKTGPFKFHHPEMPRWMVWAGFAGWLMIVVGVAGEFVFEGAVNTWSEELEIVSNALLRDAQLTAAEATSEAGSATQSAIRADTAASKADTDAGGAQRKASRAASLAFRANSEARSASALAGTAEDKASKALSTLAWRTVTPEQKESLRRALTAPPNFVAPFSGWKIVINLAADCLECNAYAAKLVEAFNGLGTEPSFGANLLGTSSEGVVVSVNPSVARAPIPLKLLNGLTAAGASPVGTEDKGLPVDTISITVFPKPHTEQ